MKTPDEIKKGLEYCTGVATNCDICPYQGCNVAGSSPACDTEMEADALTYIQQLEAKVPDWISTEEMVPEYGKQVLFIAKERQRIRVGSYRGTGGQGAHYFFSGNRLETAMWWMPLPDMPKEEV